MTRPPAVFDCNRQEDMEAIGFIAKKIVSIVCYPYGFALLLIIGGLAAWRWKSRSRAGFFFVLAGTTVLLLFSFPVTGCLLLGFIEGEAGSYANPDALQRKNVRYIVVLAGDLARTDLTPADGVGSSIYRIMEGIRLWKELPQSRLVLSGGSYPGESSEAAALAALPLMLGVPSEALVLETRAWDTEDEARIFAKLVGTEHFGLVTSAVHMWRAMKHFQRFGLNPIPCPCEFQTKRCPPTYAKFLPAARGLWMSQVAIHEYVGTLWLMIKPRPGS